MSRVPTVPRRGLLARHRPLAVLLPVSLVVAWTLALGHGDALPAPADNQGILADAFTALALSPAWRMLWWLWLAGALVLLEALGRRYRLADLTIVALGAVLIASPMSFWAFGWASTDGPLIFFGALALWLGSRLADGSGSGWWLVFGALVAGAFGLPAALISVVVLLLLIGTAVVRGAGARLVGFGSLAVLAALVLPLLGIVLGVGAAPGSVPIAPGTTIGILRPLRQIFDAMVETGLNAAATGISLPAARLGADRRRHRRLLPCTP